MTTSPEQAELDEFLAARKRAEASRRVAAQVVDIDQVTETFQALQARAQASRMTLRRDDPEPKRRPRGTAKRRARAKAARRARKRNR